MDVFLRMPKKTSLQRGGACTVKWAKNYAIPNKIVT